LAIDALATRIAAQHLLRHCRTVTGVVRSVPIQRSVGIVSNVIDG